MDRPTLIPCRCVVWRVLGDEDDCPTLVADGVDFHPARFDTGVDADDLAHAALKYGAPGGWIITGEITGLYAPATDVYTEADRLEDTHA